MPSAKKTVLILVAIAISASAQCPPNGLAVSLTGTRLGDPVFLDLVGSPYVSGLLAFDTDSGPVATPIGTVCLGLTPGLQLFPFTLDGIGAFSASAILPANPALSGFSTFLQAAAADPSQPGGIALSNGLGLTLRPPRIFFFYPGVLNPFSSIPGSFCIYDALTDVATTGAIPLPSSVLHAIHVPALGLIAILLGNSTVLVLDANTAAPVLTIPLPGSPGTPIRLAADGNTLLVLYSGTPPNPFSPGGPGALRSFFLPSGAPGITAQLPSGIPDDLMVLPGQGLAYLRIGSSVTPVNLVTGALSPSISLGGSSGPVTEWTLQNGFVYCLMGGTATGSFALPPGINAIDTTTHTAVLPAPAAFAVAPPMTTFRHGPGSTGVASMFAFIPATGSIVELSTFNFGLLNTIPLGAGILDMQLSAGGSEWLILRNGLGAGGLPELQTMTPPILIPTTVTPLPASTQPLLLPLPSATLRKAFLVVGTNAVVPFQTDSTAIPTSIVPLPVSAGLFHVVVD